MLSKPQTVWECVSSRFSAGFGHALGNTSVALTHVDIWDTSCENIESTSFMRFFFLIASLKQEWTYNIITTRSYSGSELGSLRLFGNLSQLHCDLCRKMLQWEVHWQGHFCPLGITRSTKTRWFGLPSPLVHWRLLRSCLKRCDWLTGKEMYNRYKPYNPPYFCWIMPCTCTRSTMKCHAGVAKQWPW
jgi:hypothetical protein